MEDNILEILKENNKLLQENIKFSKENSKKIKKIQSYMRRTFIARILYWMLVILVTAGALYAVRPYVEKVVSSYNTIQEKFDSHNDILDPSHLFKDIGILNQLFEIFSEKDIITTNTNDK